MSDLSRRDLLKAAALATAGIATAGPFSSAIAENITAGSHPDLAPPAPPNRNDARGSVRRARRVRVGIVGTGLRGRSVLNEFLGIEGVGIVALCDVVPTRRARRRRWSPTRDSRRRRYTRRRSRVRAARRARRHRSRLHGDAVGIARAGHARRARARKHGRANARSARRSRISGRSSTRARRRAPLHAPRELQLRLQRDAREPDGPRGRVRRGAARRGGVSARPAQDTVRESGRGTVAPRLAHAIQLEPVSDARARSRELVSRHPRRRPVRLSGRA